MMYVAGAIRSRAWLPFIIAETHHRFAELFKDQHQFREHTINRNSKTVNHYTRLDYSYELALPTLNSRGHASLLRGFVLSLTRIPRPLAHKII